MKESKLQPWMFRSITPKTAPFSEYVTCTNLDIVAVTETWLKHDETKSTIDDISPPGYSFFHEPRADQRTGVRRRCRHTSVRPIKYWHSSSAIILNVRSDLCTYRKQLVQCSGFFVCLYRLESGTCQFFDEFQDLLENIISLHDNLYILGDFNLHLENSNGNTNKFNKILTCFDFKQHVNFPTHVHGHWLDLLITKRISYSIKSVSSAAGMSTVVRRNGYKYKISFRKINIIDYESFHSDILNFDLIKKPEKDLSALCQQYDSVLGCILDKHAPVSTKTLPRKPPTPWITPVIMKAKTLRHSLERTWRRSRTHLDRSRYKHQCPLCYRIMTKAKSQYLADVIS